jgi:4a-hydroxytetrahydrobiopterin dehydratase
LVCTDCERAAEILSSDARAIEMNNTPGWGYTPDYTAITRVVQTTDFVSALELAQILGDAAEVAGHHPDLLVQWGKLTVTIATHSVGGLTNADFRLARMYTDILAQWSTSQPR